MTDEEAIQAAGRPYASPSVNPNITTGVMELPPDAAEWLKTLSPDLAKNYEQLQSVIHHPVGQFSLVLIRDPQFRDSVAEISAKFDRNAFLGYEIVWIVLIWVLKAWRTSKVSTWPARLWVQVWVGMVFWTGTLLLIPSLLWGKSYQNMVLSVFRALIHQF